MAKTSKIQREPSEPLSYSPDEVQQQIGLIPSKLDQVVTRHGLSYNKVAKTIGSRPDVLYRIRDGESLPSCETIINLKNVFPELDLNWWLCDEGGPMAAQEIERLKAIIKQLRGELIEMQQHLTQLIDNTSTGDDPRNAGHPNSL